VLVNELAHLHGGHVDVKSEVGRGTTFSVTMPFGAEHLDASQIVLDSNIGRLGSMNGARRRRSASATCGRFSEALPTIVWTATPDGAGDYFNERACWNISAYRRRRLSAAGGVRRSIRTTCL
jgi:hypothetical protein